LTDLALPAAAAAARKKVNLFSEFC
jgi:hypothetical protein